VRNNKRNKGSGIAAVGAAELSHLYEIELNILMGCCCLNNRKKPEQSELKNIDSTHVINESKHDKQGEL
jgi:hypothetical protein